MSFPRYERYKYSGVEWLGEVPEHWTVCALNYRYEVALGKMLDEKRITGNHLAPYLRNVDVQWGKINTTDLPQMDFSGADLERYSLRPGDLVVCEGGEVGRAAVWNAELKECFYQKAIHRLRPRTERDAIHFFFHLLRCAVALGAFSSNEAKATIAHLPAETFRRHFFPFPPICEQRSIFAFLDYETAKIDALIEQQQLLIDLLM
jgi:type I restriction enzyme S subunit